MISIAKPLIGEAEKKAVAEVLDSGMIANGAIVTQFENEFAAYLGAKYAVATTSGTTALEVALRSLGIGNGDKVLTTPFSFIASTNAILYAGAAPVFADILPDAFTIDPDAVEAALRADPTIKALLIVHLFGQACDMDRIMALVDRYKLILIEDCAQAHGAAWNGKPVGTFGDAGCFSFYPTKNMTTGEGGMVVTNREDLRDTAKLLINHGMKIRYHHDIIGYNYRMTNIAGAIGLCQLKRLPEFNARRRANAAELNRRIANPRVVAPFVVPGSDHCFHQYSVLIEDGLRDEFTAFLSANEVGFGVFYPFTIPEQRCYASFGFRTDYPVSDRIKTQIVSLPVHPGLTSDEIAVVARVVNAFGA